jgi:hypothetical protein
MSSAAELPAELTSALNQDYPDWTFPSADQEVVQAFAALNGADPNAISGDFDGDGHTDYAVRLHTPSMAENKALIVTYVSREGSFDKHVLPEVGEISRTFLWLARKGGMYPDIRKHEEIRLTNDSVGVASASRAGWIWVLENSTWNYFFFAD